MKLVRPGCRGLWFYDYEVCLLRLSKEFPGSINGKTWFWRPVPQSNIWALIIRVSFLLSGTMVDSAFPVLLHQLWTRSGHFLESAFATQTKLCLSPIILQDLCSSSGTAPSHSGFDFFVPLLELRARKVFLVCLLCFVLHSCSAVFLR